MLLKEMIEKYPRQYIAVAHVDKGIDNLIKSAMLVKVYPTLQEAYASKSEIKRFMSRYNDFDIVYGDYEDYTLTRRKMTFVSEKELLSQDEIDEVIELLKNPNPS